MKTRENRVLDICNVAFNKLKPCINQKCDFSKFRSLFLSFLELSVNPRPCVLPLVEGGGSIKVT